MLNLRALFLMVNSIKAQQQELRNYIYNHCLVDIPNEQVALVSNFAELNHLAHDTIDAKILEFGWTRALVMT